MGKTRRSGRSGIARGRMYLKARLGWLSGFPLGQSAGKIAWLALPRFGDHSPEEMTITWRDLHRTARTWQKLTTRFPRALPQILDDLDHWQRGVPLMLSLLSEAIHDGAPLPVSLFNSEGFYPPEVGREAQGVATDRPRLRPWLAALSWLGYLYPAEAAAALAWSRDQAAAIETILARNEGPAGLVLAHHFWSLAHRDGPELPAALLGLFGDDRLYTTPIGGAAGYAERWAELAKKGRIEAGDNTERPEPSMAASLAPFVAWLAGQPRPVRQDALALFNLAWPDEVLPAWAGWWASTDQMAAQARKLIPLPGLFVGDRGPRLLAIRRQLQAARKQLPPGLDLPFFLQQLTTVALETDLCRELLPLLALAPAADDRPLRRADLLAFWFFRLYRIGKLPALLRCIRNSWQAAAALPNNLAHRMPALSTWYDDLPGKWAVEDEILAEVPEQRLWPVICDTIVAHGGLRVQREKKQAQDSEVESIEYIDPYRLLELAKITEDADQAGELAASLAAVTLHTNTYLESDLLRLAYHLDGGGHRFGELVARLQPGWYEFSWSYKDVLAAPDRLEAAGWQGLAAELVLDGQVGRLNGVGARLDLLAEFGLDVAPPSPLPPDSPTAAWIATYPSELQPALRLLAALHPDAQAAAARVLGKEFADTERLRQEMAALREKLNAEPAQPHLARRLANLEERLTAPRPVSAQRLARLEEKLRHLVAHQALAVWERALDDALRPALGSVLEMAQPPEWLLEPAQLRLIAGILQLPAAFRDLALRLLRLRSGPPPWRPLDDPANRQFIAAMEAAGLRLEPWLNPPGPRRFTGDNGRVVELRFEDDPLEIFQMGSRFNTCLSVGNPNFFSVFANAADANKHVIYARDVVGQVAGRCLLALTEDGNLLTFEPYCHDSQLGFDKMVAEIATDLAGRMGAALHIRGRVPPLVAPDWYDDGPRDVTGRFAFLRSDSDFVKALPDLSPESFLQQLESLFAPLPIDAIVLPMILFLRELGRRPALIKPLIPYLEAAGTLPDEAMRLAIWLAYQAGEYHFVRQALARWAPSFLERRLRLLRVPYHRANYEDLMSILAEFEPSAALRYLRASRPRGVRRDEQEQGWRREAMAIAHEKLGRHALARKLREESTGSR